MPDHDKTKAAPQSRISSTSNGEEGFSWTYSTEVISAVTNGLSLSLFFTQSLSSWRPAGRLPPRSTGPVNHSKMNECLSKDCTRIVDAVVLVELPCCSLPYQMQLVIFDPVSPATVFLLSDLLTHQFVSLPCHQRLQRGHRRARINTEHLEPSGGVGDDTGHTNYSCRKSSCLVTLTCLLSSPSVNSSKTWPTLKQME